MKILCISVGDNGGGTYWIADAINKHTDHEARSVRFVQSWINYPYDIFAPSQAELRDLVKWADVLHVRDNVSDKWYPTISGKPTVITWTGMSYRRRAADKLKMCQDRGFYPTVSTPDLVSLTPKNPPEWLPNLRWPMEGRKGVKLIACHAPTFRERKGTSEVIKACELAQVQLELVENMPFWRSLKRKALCNVVIDQFAYGYGNNAIEAWAMGIPVISGAYKSQYLDLVRDNFGALPFYNCKERPQDIAVGLQVLQDKREYDLYAKLGQDYYRKYHDPAIVAHKAIEIYKKVL